MSEQTTFNVIDEEGNRVRVKADKLSCDEPGIVQLISNGLIVAVFPSAIFHVIRSDCETQ